MKEYRPLYLQTIDVRVLGYTIHKPNRVKATLANRRHSLTLSLEECEGQQVDVYRYAAEQLMKKLNWDEHIPRLVGGSTPQGIIFVMAPEPNNTRTR